MKTILEIESIFNPASGGTFFAGILTGNKEMFSKSLWVLTADSIPAQEVTITSEQWPDNHPGRRILVSETFYDKDDVPQGSRLELIRYL